MRQFYFYFSPLLQKNNSNELRDYLKIKKGDNYKSRNGNGDG